MHSADALLRQTRLPLQGLRVRLTVLYLLITLTMILLVGAGSYYGLHTYFVTMTDDALRHKMVHEFHLLQEPLPNELKTADQDWSAQRTDLFRAGRNLPEREDEDDLEYNNHIRYQADSERTAAELVFDAELAAIFVLPLRQDATPLLTPDPQRGGVVPDLAAALAAMRFGSDLRTVRAPGGTRVRLLTYRLARSDDLALLQLGRSLTDQDQVLGQLLWGFGLLAILSAAAMGCAGWWLSGRSLWPALQAWERQQVFVANASHELRTPLTLMRASVEVAQRGLPEIDSDRHELLCDAIHECDHMNRLVEDLLLLSRLDAGQLALRREPICLAELIGEIERLMRPLIEAKQLSLVATHIEGVALADAARVRQVLLILLDNALRYTPSGGSITLKTVVQDRQVYITISDTGIGIAPEHQVHIFERFWRADSTSPHQQRGTGLGLAIARQLVEAQQGKIGVESTPQQGSRFWVALPAQA